MTTPVPAPPRRRPHRLLWGGAVLFLALAALTVESVRREWHRRVGEERAAALFQLVQDKTPPRPTETPGVTAWLHLALKRYRGQIADPERARLYAEIADWQDRRSVPPALAPVRDLLAAPLVMPAPPAAPRWAAAEPGADMAAGRSPLQFRAQRFLEIDGYRLVVTRRKALEEGAGASDRFLAQAAPRLLALGKRLAAALAVRPLPAVPGPVPPRVARVYALSEDGTLVSLPLAELTADRDVRRQAAAEEGREFRKLPQLPNFVSNEFFFQFDFTRPAGQVYYSGLYLDLGGQGVVATVTVPYADPASGAAGVLGADLTFALDWRAFARQIEPPMVAEVVTLPPPPEERWRPWNDVLAALPAAGNSAALARAVAAAAERERREGLFVVPGSVQHSAVEGQGAVAALQVAARDWLVILFPKTAAGFPVLSLALLLLPLGLLLGGFEAVRRRAERAQAKAERELAEKQNLLNTMQVPLLVVDPNSDAVVFGNAAARRLGIDAGVRIADLVPDEERARRHYERMQVAGPDARRAYGLPLRLRDESGAMETRYAVVRSVAVAAPIEALQADERHRLGILFVLDREADLALLTEEMVAEAQGGERRRLAGLLSHGVDTLVRVLAHTLARPASAADAADRAFVLWLSAYVERRIRVTAWLLDRWDAAPSAAPTPPACAIEPSHARETLAALERVFARVAADPALRSSLHWDNGALAAAGEGDPVLALSMDWPARYWFPLPVRGGFGLFLEEVLVNAVRHGRPGTVPRVALHIDRGRRELLCEIENELRDGTNVARIEPYGGRRLLERLARLFGWQDLRFERDGGRFAVSWRVPVSEREEAGEAD